ncbi:protein takeout-like [Daktulosphaira vitifoliae]|uniref:protein takeout-like n=1 Tax=Daktulosphaira vitifoliae TaxID=58002 RepID=UPI0021A9B468|nr:protein takeout-like [Daktulosphaira vitifoliae]
MIIDTLKITCYLVCISSVAFAAPSTFKLPKGFVQCKKSDPKFNECVKDSLQSALPHLVKGVPSLGLISVDPLRISSLGIDQGSGPVSIKLNFKDLDISNIGTAKIQNVNVDLDKFNITLDINFDKPMVLDGNYDIKGKVIILPITGNGLSKIVLENFKAKINIYLKTITKNGQVYLEITDLVFRFSTTLMRLKLDNLFKGDKVLGANMNTFLNDNWKEILGELQPNFETAFAAAFTGVSKQFFQRAPYNQIFKD